MNIVIKGLPISKMRPRLGKSKVYDPQGLLKQAVRTSIRGQVHKTLQDTFNLLSATACRARMVFYFSPSKNLSKAKRKAKLSNLEPCLVRNDLDNLEKFYLDCANGILFEDDHQIVELSSKKLWSEEPRVEMEVLPYLPNQEGKLYA
jgi:Holliday junction resolvase RusA-like endonuclease